MDLLFISALLGLKPGTLRVRELVPQDQIHHIGLRTRFFSRDWDLVNLACSVRVDRQLCNLSVAGMGCVYQQLIDPQFLS